MNVKNWVTHSLISDSSFLGNLLKTPHFIGVLSFTNTVTKVFAHSNYVLENFKKKRGFNGRAFTTIKVEMLFEGLSRSSILLEIVENWHT